MAIIPILVAVFIVQVWPVLAQKIGFERGDARWVSNTKLCDQGNTEHGSSGYIRVPMTNEPDVIDFVFRKIDAIDVWFWHFPARENSTTAPLAIFLGGGQPATPSAERVFGPTGPCTWNRGLRIATKEEYADYGPTTNWLSYNRKVNLLYIDIPASVGFTHGRHKENTVSMAKKDTWAFLQRFLDTFPEYKNREVALWDFDFGAHYATHLAALIHERNEHIREGTTEGNMVNLTSLGLVSPLLDLPIQHRASLRFARENKHRPVLNRNMTSDLIREYDDDHAFWWSRCAADRTRDCRSEMRSYKAQFYKLTVDEAPVVQLPKLEMGPTRKGSGPTWDGPLSILKPVEMIPRPPPLRLSYDPWDVRLPRPGDRWRGLSEMPPERSVKTTWFLNKEEVQSWLGVDVGVKKYEPFDQAIWDKIKEKQEVMRSSVQTLRQVVQNGVRVLIVGGDADMMSSHIGVSEILDKIEGENTTVWSDMVPMEFQTGLLSPNGTAERKIGECKTRGNVTWFLLNDMGHDLETQDPILMRFLFNNHVFGRPFDNYLVSKKPER